MPRKIVIADPANSSDKVECGLLRCPDPYPEFSMPENFVKATTTRMTSTVGGRRTFSFGGINSNHWDISFTLHLILPAEVAKLRAWYSARPPIVRFSLDGVQFYWAIFLPGGCEVIGYKNNEDYDLAQPFHNKVEIKLAILTEIP